MLFPVEHGPHFSRGTSVAERWPLIRSAVVSSCLVVSDLEFRRREESNAQRKHIFLFLVIIRLLF